MIQVSPELAPMTRESRDLLSLFLRSMSLGGLTVKAMQDAPVTRLVRMPRYLQIGLVFRGGAKMDHGLGGKRDLRGTRNPKRRLTEEPTGPADIAHTKFDAIAVKLRHALSEGKVVLAALERLPEDQRQSWQNTMMRALRDALPALETLAYAEIDAARMIAPANP
jgi:hypothetical protein